MSLRQTETLPGDGVTQLYQLYHLPIVRYLNQIVHDYAAAEDLSQETFIKAMRHWGELLEPAAVRGWLSAQ